MPRDNSGNYSLPAGNPVVDRTPITNNWANDTLSDIADALTKSLARDGRGAMTAALKAFAGFIGSPGLSFADDTTTGWFLNAPGDLRGSVGGVNFLRAITGQALRLIGLGADHATDAGLIIDTVNAITDPATRILSAMVQGVAKAYITAAGAGYFAGQVAIDGAPSASTHAVRKTDLDTALVRGGGFSSSCGMAALNTSVYAEISNLTASVTTHGGPVLVALVPAASAASLNVGPNGSGIYSIGLKHQRDGLSIGEIGLYEDHVSSGAQIALHPSLIAIDFPAAGTYAYTTAGVSSSGSATLCYYRLFARELF